MKQGYPHEHLHVWDVFVGKDGETYRRCDLCSALDRYDRNLNIWRPTEDFIE